MKIKYAETVKPIFLQGLSGKSKFDILLNRGIKLEYDRKERELTLVYQGNVAIIPSSNIVSMTLLNEQDEKKLEAPVTHKNHPMLKGIIKAQVGAPNGIKVE